MSARASENAGLSQGRLSYEVVKSRKTINFLREPRRPAQSLKRESNEQHCGDALAAWLNAISIIFRVKCAAECSRWPQCLQLTAAGGRTSGVLMRFPLNYHAYAVSPGAGVGVMKHVLT